MLDVLVESAKDVEEENSIIDKRSHIGQSICHALELVLVFTHREAILYKIEEGNIKVKSTCLVIIRELVLETEP
jgi:hypothetical protein